MKISALSETGNPVDWWFIYKVPELNGGSGTDKATGYEYVYYDSEMDGDKDPRNRNVVKSKFVLNSDKGALNETLDSVFKKPEKTTGWILYNDEMPISVGKKDDGHKGHTKGVLAFDVKTETGFWLLHSWPKFVDPQATADPTPMYGQTYLCVTLSLDTLRAVATQMANHQEPQVFMPRIPDALPKTDPLYILTQPLQPNPPKEHDFIDLKTLGGMSFKVIAKNKEWGGDFWNGLVGPTLKDDMADDTWIRGKVPPIADTDGIHKTFDITYVNLGPMGAHWAWPETHDHAKWGVTKHSPWICVGDINRMISQRMRGGGTIAFQNNVLWLGLSKAGLVLAPPGHSRTEAHALIARTHKPETEAPPKANQPAAKEVVAKATPDSKAKPEAKATKPAKKTGKKSDGKK